MIFVVTDIITIFIALNHTVLEKLAKKIMNIFPRTARAFLLSVRALLGLVSNLVRTDIMRLLPKDLCTLLLYGNNDFSFLVNRGVIEETIKYIRNTKRFK